MVFAAALAFAPAAVAAPATPEPPAAGDVLPDDAALRREVEAMRRELAASKAEVQALEARVEQLAQSEEPSLTSSEVQVDSGNAVDEAIAVWHDVHVRGRVKGDALSVGGDVEVHDGGWVEGDAVSIGGKVVVHEGGFVAGDRVAVHLGDAPDPTPQPAADHHAVGSLVLAAGADETMRWLYHRLVWMLTVAGAGVVTVGLFPDRVARVATDVSRRPVRSAVVGTLATSLLSLFAVLFVALTFGLGSPVSLAIFAALGVAWLLGFVGFCQALGDRLPVDSKVHGRWLALAAGVLVLAFAGSLPWVGWFGLLGISMVGIGAALSTRFGATTA
jgi:hypothetical protein